MRFRSTTLALIHTLRSVERGSAGRLLSYGCAVRSVSARSDILDFDRHDIAPAKLAVDRQIEHGEVAGATFDLEFRPDCPDISGPQRRLRPCQLTFVPRHAFADRSGGVLLICVRQVVVLGAGLDTFSLRNPFADLGVRVFEVDYAATQVWKRERIKAAGLVEPQSLVFRPSTSSGKVSQKA